MYMLKRASNIICFRQHRQDSRTVSAETAIFLIQSWIQGVVNSNSTEFVACEKNPRRA